MPVVAVAAMSLDGKITFHDHPGNAFTSAADKKHFFEVLRRFDCSILGRTTFEASKDFILASLTEKRLRVVYTRTPEAYAELAVPGQLEFSSELPSELLKSLESRGYTHCVHLGGSDTYAAFQEADCIDSWWVTLEPRIFGTGRPLCSGTHDVSLRLESFERLPDSHTLLLQYQRDQEI